MSSQLLRRSPRGARGPAGARNRRSGPWRSGSCAEPPVHPLQLRTHALVGEKSLRPGRYSCPAWRGPACQIRARSFRDLSLRVTQLHQLADAARRAGAAACPGPRAAGACGGAAVRAASAGASCSRTEVPTQDHGSPPMRPAYVRWPAFRGRPDSTITGIRRRPLTIPAVSLDTP